MTMEKEKAINILKDCELNPCVPEDVEVAHMAIKALKQTIEKCTWIRYDYRTICPQNHDADNPYWRIPINRMETLKYCPYCGKEIEVEK